MKSALPQQTDLAKKLPLIKTNGAPLLSFIIEISLKLIELSFLEQKIAFMTASFAANFPEKCIKGLDLELQ